MTRRLTLRGWCRWRRLGVATAVSSFLYFIVSPSNAEIIFSNLSDQSYGTDSTAFSGPLAQSFSTGVTRLAIADLDLDLAATNPADSGTLIVTLMADAGTSPGSEVAALGTIPDSALSSSRASYDLELASPITLLAGTRYWVEISGTVSSAGWSYTSDGTGPGASSEYTYNNYNDGGAPGVASFSAGGLYQMCIASTAEACVPSVPSGGGDSSGETGGSSGPPTPPGISTPPTSPPSDPPPSPPSPPSAPSPPSISGTSAPEPGTLVVLAAALVSLGVARWWTRRTVPGNPAQ